MTCQTWSDGQTDMIPVIAPGGCSANMYLNGGVATFNFQGVLELCDAGTAGVALWLGCSEEAHHEDQSRPGI